MGRGETREEMGYDNLTSQTRKEEERGREWKTERERERENEYGRVGVTLGRQNPVT